MSELSGLPGSRFIPVVQQDAEVISRGVPITKPCSVCKQVVKAVFLPSKVVTTKHMQCSCGHVEPIQYVPEGVR